MLYRRLPLALALYVMLFTYCFIGSNHQLCAQEHKDITSFNPDDILVQGEKLPKILLVGSFHFNYPNLDSHKTDAADQVDIATAKKQAEVRELLDYIAQFKPNKIVVERRSGSKINDYYRKYLAGDFELPKGEIFQLGFRLGERFGVDSLILGDAFHFQNSLWWSKDSTIFRPMIDSLWEAEDPDWDTTINTRYYELYDVEDKLEAKSRLLDVFKHMNDPHRIRRGHGHYLELDSDEDADALAIWWYSRNLRIYRNIRKATTSPEDRILVIFGAGHMGILRQQFESSPAYEMIEFNQLGATDKR